jgi:hypothetical protein
VYSENDKLVTRRTRRLLRKGLAMVIARSYIFLSGVDTTGRNLEGGESFGGNRQVSFLSFM